MPEALRRALIATGHLLAFGAAAHAQPCHQWTPITITPNPVDARYDHSAVYHPGLGLHIVGGTHASIPGGPATSSFILGPAGWSQGPGSPGPYLGTGVAYDAARQCEVLFGGTPGGQNSTWTFDGFNAWQVVNSTGPGRAQHAMVYDSARAVVVMFGGQTSQPLGDTWEWNGQQWAQRAPAQSPPARRNHAMAYDAAHQVTVLFGGLGSQTLADTWLWNGVTWTQAQVAGPSARFDHAMGYDAGRAVTVLVGGGPAGTAGPTDSQTWEWSGSAWELAVATAPFNPRGAATLTYDPDRAGVVLFGGGNNNYAYNDLWLYASGYPANISGQPQSLQVVPGAPATLSVTANSQSPITYQWRRQGAPIPGATSPTLTLYPVVPSDAGTYDVLVSTVCGTQTSDPATLSITCQPVISHQPQSVAAPAGAPATFSVGVANASPTFQWLRNNTPLPGQTGPSITVVASGATAGEYTVQVTTPCGSLSSAPATLSILASCYANCDGSTPSRRCSTSSTSTAS